MCKMTRRIEPLDAERLGQRLKTARQARGMTLEQVAKACDMHHGQVSRIERGRFCFLNGNVQKICTIVAAEPDVLAGASRDELHALLDRLLRERPAAAAALRAVFEAFGQMAN